MAKPKKKGRSEKGMGTPKATLLQQYDRRPHHRRETAPVVALLRGRRKGFRRFPRGRRRDLRATSAIRPIPRVRPAYVERQSSRPTFPFKSSDHALFYGLKALESPSERWGRPVRKPRVSAHYPCRK